MNLGVCFECTFNGAGISNIDKCGNKNIFQTIDVNRVLKCKSGNNEVIAALKTL